MKILGVYLENIRSYKKTVVVFPPRGITVIHGEIGSGKTSLLMAIEFALLGLSGTGSSGVFDAYKQPKGADLLRVDSSWGRVKLLVQIGRDKLYIIERRIEKKGNSYDATVGVVEEAVIENDVVKPVGKKLFTSRSELDDYILSILGIREKKKARATPLVFTTAIYIPQFNVQEVLTLDKDRRIEIIERALGLDKYKLFKTNTSTLLDKLRREKIQGLERELESMRRILRGRNKEQLLRDREEKQKVLDELKRERDRIEQGLKTIEKKREEVINQIRLVEKRKNELSTVKKTYEEKNSELVKTEKELQLLLNEYETQASLEELINQLNTRLQQLEEKKKELNNKLLEVEKKEEEIVKKIEEKNNQLSEILVRKTKIEEGVNAKKKERDKLLNERNRVNKLIEEGICPVCGQRIPHEHGRKLLEEIERNIESINNEIEEMEKQIREIQSTLLIVKEEARKLLGEREQVVRERQNIMREISRIDEEARILTSKQTRIDLLLKQRNRILEELLKINIKQVEEEIHSLEEQIKKYEEERVNLESTIKQLYSKLRDIDREIGSVEQAIKNIEKEINEIERINREIQELEREKKKYEELKGKLEAIQSIVDDVEKTVMKILVDEFRTYFYNFLSKLVGDQPVEVVVTDDFGVQPKIRIGGTTYSVSSLSGGQSIAVSLAYRLALNMIVRTYSQSLRRAVLILDEPTTGFSREIVNRLRSVLKEASGRNGQVLVVTHDRELIDAGDCRLKLSLDPIEHKTIIEYRDGECTHTSQAYREFVEKALLSGFIKPTTLPF